MFTWIAIFGLPFSHNGKAQEPAGRLRSLLLCTVYLYKVLLVVFKNELHLLIGDSSRSLIVLNMIAP